MAESRTKAQALILAGRVSVDGQPARHAGSLVSEGCALEIEKVPSYVSRGGDKLQAALDHWRLDPAGAECLDVGASTGGFTDCLLSRGARHVTAVDVGYGQLHARLRADPRVTFLEETNVRDWKPQTGPFDWAVVDVSFISLKKVLPRILGWVKPGGTVLPMLKPQFEADPKLAKKGVVRDEAVRLALVEDMEHFISESGARVEGHFASPVHGPKGNVEYFLYVRT